MTYRVYRLDIKLEKEQQKPESFLNDLKVEVVSIIPNHEVPLFESKNKATPHSN